MFRKVPRTGTRLRKLIAAGKKPEKSRKNPYDSMIMPINGNPTSTTMMPPKKAIDPFSLCFWKKKRNVLSRPITQARPQRKRIWKGRAVNKIVSAELPLDVCTYIAYGQ